MKPLTNNSHLQTIKQATPGDEIQFSADQAREVWKLANDHNLFTDNRACVGRQSTQRWEYECKFENVYFELHAYGSGSIKIISGSHF